MQDSRGFFRHKIVHGVHQGRPCKNAALSVSKLRHCNGQLQNSQIAGDQGAY